MDDDTQFSIDAGRHHHAAATDATDAATWTPMVPVQARPEHRTTHEPHPTGFPAVNGATAGKLTGELPVTPQQRTRVDLTEPSRTGGTNAPRGSVAPHEPPSEDERDREPAPGGLGVFDLGSVPASVTPPGTWRRAAWFAAASSGSVVGLLFAGAFLLGQQSDQQQDTGDWSYLTQNDDAALVEHGQQSATTEPSPAPHGPRNTDAPTESATVPSNSTNSRNGSAPEDSDTANKSGNGHSSGDTSEPTRSSHGDQELGSDRPVTAGADQDSGTTQDSTTEHTPESADKPPETTVVEQHQQQLVPQRAGHESDPDEMAQTSIDYLNSVATDPEQAAEYTSGDLRDDGADGLRSRYEQVTDLAVQKIAVNPTTGVTENTVDTTYEDGHTERETVQLTFDEDGKISDADR